MTNYYGWAGTILNADLTTGKMEREALSPAFARKYLGACGFNSARLFEWVKPNVDALSPENVLMFGVGTLNGTLGPCSARLTVTAKSPLTGIFGDSNMGGHFSTELKFAGYDQVNMFGKADQPVYLWIDNDNIELREATHLWGKTTWDTARMIKDEIGDPFIQVICIGPAGENLVRFANIMCPTKKAAGRTGMGAVMGSKNLKAVAVRGSKDLPIARPDEFLDVCKKMREEIVSEELSEMGTPYLMDWFAPEGLVVVRNFQSNVMKNWEALSGKTLKKDFYRSMRACASCHIACSPFHSVKSGEFTGVYGEGPEYALTEDGLLWDIDNLPAMLKINELFNQFGMDNISGGFVMAWAMDCYEKGILTEEDCDGTPLSFGDYKAVIEMIPKIARREGFGDILAEGEKRAPQILGKGSEQHMYHVKGLSPIADEGRAKKNLGLQYLTSTRGADHLKAYVIAMGKMLRDTDIGKEVINKKTGYADWSETRNPEGMGVTVKWCEDMKATADAVGICVHTVSSIQLLTRALSSATGIDFSEDELLEIGERIYNIQKAFNSRQGLTRKDDNFSTPKYYEPIKDGKFKDEVLERDELLDDYYKARGWDVKTGLQTREKLEELGLNHIADELEKVNAIK